MSENMEPGKAAEFVSVGEAAVRLDLAASTVRRWCDEGVLKNWQTFGKHRRVSVASIDEALAARRIAS